MQRSAVRSTVIVVPHEPFQLPQAFVVREVLSGIGPLVLQDLDEGFSLAVGLRAVWPGALEADTVICSDLAEGERDVVAAVVGEDALDAYSQGSEECQRSHQEGGGGGAFLIGEGFNIGVPAMIVDGDV